MLNNDSLNQYSWVMKVLDSCQNDAQVGTTEKLFELYKKRWSVDMTQKHIVTLTANFDKEKKSKLYKLKKKGQTFLSNISQFFLF
jgi:Zn/Cd-binding protein ZinT